MSILQREWRAFGAALAGLLWGALLGISCARVIPPSTLPDGTAVVREAIPSAYVTIRNDNWNHVRVYISENGGTPRRISSIETNRVETVGFRVNDGSRYTFTILPLAGNGGYTTEGIATTVGDTLRLYIANHLEFSTLIRTSR